MKRLSALVLALLLLVTASCMSRSSSRSDIGSSPGPVLVVERFLQAANANDLETMMQLFGTADRTIDQLDGRSKAERRMHVLASVLRHDDFTIMRQAPLAGRMRSAVELQVQLRKGDQLTLVPWVVVEKKGGGWIIERIDIETLTAR